MKTLVGFLVLAFMSIEANAVSKQLRYQASDQLSPEKIMEQVYYVNQFYSFSHVPFAFQPKGLFTLVKKSKYSTQGVQFERYMNFDLAAPEKAKDLILIKTGHQGGTSMLITDYVDDSRSSMIQVWMPQLRKVRRVAEFNDNDLWFGSAFTHGDMKHRKPAHETHEIVGGETYGKCAETIQIASDSHWSFYGEYQSPCMSLQRETILVKSTPKAEYVTYYDYRMSYIDSQNYGDYKTEYYKNDQLIKVVEKNWLAVGMPDPRAQIFSHWYVKDYAAGTEAQLSMMPLEKESYPEMWTDAFLRKTKR